MHVWAQVTLITPSSCFGDMVALLKDRRGKDIEVIPMDESAAVKALGVRPVDGEASSGSKSESVATEQGVGSQILVSAIVPWQEVVCDLNDQIKHLSSGYASFNYEPLDYEESDLVKVEVAVNGEVCDPLSIVAHTSKAEYLGRKLITKLKAELDRQQFEIILQAKIGTKV